jgi:hypothetical protein
LQVQNLRVAGNFFLPDANVGRNGNLYFGGITDAGEIGLRLFGGNVNGNLPSGFIDVRAGTPKDGLIFRVDTAIGGTEHMRITAKGDVGIGTPDPRFKLEVAGDAAKPGGGTWTSSSDLNLKKNVKSLQDALDTLLQLRGVSFEWKEPEKQGNLTGTQMGMVAQEVEKTIPGWVGTSPDGTKNLTIRGFEALVVEAVREMNSKVDQLLQRMEALEQQLGITAPSAPALEEETPVSEAEIEDESRATNKSTRKKSKK